MKHRDDNYLSKDIDLNFLEDFTLMLNWVETAPGSFCVNDLSHDIEVRFLLTEKLEKMVKANYLERVGTKRGWYRRRESVIEEMDFVNIEAEPVDIWLPFEVGDMVEIYEGNIIIIAGMKNSGKTGIILNMVHQNMNNWEVSYFNSEMGAKELRKRLDLFPYITIDNWNFNAYRRASDFADVIPPGPENLVLIDFLEVHDEFYAMGKLIKAIHDRLNGGVCVIAIQKNPGQDVGLGAWRSTEVSRLYLAVESGTVKITMAKNFRTDKNPNGLKRVFKLVNGCQIITQQGWYREEIKK